jgi:hypothetical protein
VRMLEGGKERIASCTQGRRGGAHRPIGEQVEAGGAAMNIATHENVFLFCDSSRRLDLSLVTKSCDLIRTGQGSSRRKQVQSENKTHTQPHAHIHTRDIY